MKSAKIFLTCVVLCTALSACRQEETFIYTVNVSVFDPGVGVPLNRISFANSSLGFITTSNGKVLKTTDQGASWTVISVGATNLDLRWLSTPAPQAIYASGETTSLDGQLYKSIDSGATWVAMIGNWDFELIDFPSVNRGYMISSGQLYKTTNGAVGGMWTLTNGLGTVDPQVMAFASNDTGMIVGFDGDSWITNNGGTSVTHIYGVGAGYYTIVDVKFISSTQGYAIDYQGGVSVTNDAGQTWSVLRTPGTAVGEDYWTNAVDALGSTVCVVGENTLLISKDGGSTFNNYYNQRGVSLGDNFKDVAVVSAGKIIAIGSSGKIYIITF